MTPTMGNRSNITQAIIIALLVPCAAVALGILFLAAVFAKGASS